MVFVQALIKEYCEAEFENINAVTSELFSIIKTEKTEYSIAELAAIGTFIHAYGFSLRWEELKPLVDGIEETLNKFKSAIYHYIDVHD